MNRKISTYKLSSYVKNFQAQQYTIKELANKIKRKNIRHSDNIRTTNNSLQKETSLKSSLKPITLRGVENRKFRVTQHQCQSKKIFPTIKTEDHMLCKYKGMKNQENKVKVSVWKRRYYQSQHPQKKSSPNQLKHPYLKRKKCKQICGLFKIKCCHCSSSTDCSNHKFEEQIKKRLKQGHDYLYGENSCWKWGNYPKEKIDQLRQLSEKMKKQTILQTKLCFEDILSDLKSTVRTHKPYNPNRIHQLLTRQRGKLQVQMIRKVISNKNRMNKFDQYFKQVKANFQVDLADFIRTLLEEFQKQSEAKLKRYYLNLKGNSKMKESVDQFGQKLIQNSSQQQKDQQQRLNQYQLINSNDEEPLHTIYQDSRPQRKKRISRKYKYKTDILYDSASKQQGGKSSDEDDQQTKNKIRVRITTARQINTLRTIKSFKTYRDLKSRENMCLQLPRQSARSVLILFNEQQSDLSDLQDDQFSRKSQQNNIIRKKQRSKKKKEIQNNLMMSKAVLKDGYQDKGHKNSHKHEGDGESSNEGDREQKDNEGDDQLLEEKEIKIDNELLPKDKELETTNKKKTKYRRRYGFIQKKNQMQDEKQLKLLKQFIANNQELIKQINEQLAQRYGQTLSIGISDSEITKNRKIRYIASNLKGGISKEKLKKYIGFYNKKKSHNLLPSVQQEETVSNCKIEPKFEHSQPKYQDAELQLKKYLKSSLNKKLMFYDIQANQQDKQNLWEVEHKYYLGEYQKLKQQINNTIELEQLPLENQNSYKLRIETSSPPIRPKFSLGQKQI